MRINKVHLENYRVHENLDIEFSKGINLLLGQNGKGKSSILEAIGIALFDSKPRTTLGETVTFGKKSGKIEISFTGIDGEEYLIAKKIPNGSSKLSRVSDNLTIDDKGEKIKELCGIKGELKNIFDNIIVAKQNEFISAFKDSATNREAIFNSIFNTDIYKKIGEKDLLKVYQKYETQLGIENAKYETLNSKLLNPEELTQQLQLEQHKQKEFLLKIKTHGDEEKAIESQLNTITRLELEKEKFLGQYKAILNNITNYETNEKTIDILIDESIQAEYILLENKEKYEEYNNISKLLDDKKNEQRKLSEEKKIYEDKERLKIKNQNLISQTNGNIDLCNNKIENCNISLSEKQNTLDDLIYSIKEKEKYQLEYQNSIDLIRTLLRHSENFENQLTSQENELKNFSSHLSNKQVDLEMKQNTIIALEKENLYEQLEQLKIYEQKKNTLEKRNSILDTQREENLTAYNLLKSYQCPYLKESCENLKDKDINLFFTNKLSNIEKEREKNILEIESISKELAKKSNIEESLYRLAIFKKEVEKLELEILKDTEHNLALNTSLAFIHSNYQNFKLKNNFNSREELQNEYTALKIKLDNLNLNKDIEERKKLEFFISSLTKDMSKYQEEKSLLMIKMDRLESENLAIDEYLRANSHILTQFLDITKVIDKEEEKLKSLESSKTLYLENYKKANEKENYLKEKEQIQKKLNSEQENYMIVNKQIENNQLKLNNFDKISLLEKQAEIKSVLGSLRENLGKIETQIEILSQKLIEISNDKATLEKLAKNIKKLKTKLELTQIFRTNVKDMGKEVAKNMLREIELMATDNFRKITGRGEQIIWSNEDKDKYLVYLVGNDTKLKFEQLSGGEQVAVAISIRSAMSTIFTDSKFSIFDEPTNNLDREKKQSLADSIGEILKNLEQSIIVTHDDTFKEMAEKVIYL